MMDKIPILGSDSDDSDAPIDEGTKKTPSEKGSSQSQDDNDVESEDSFQDDEVESGPVGESSHNGTATDASQQNGNSVPSMDSDDGQTIQSKLASILPFVGGGNDDDLVTSLGSTGGEDSQPPELSPELQDIFDDEISPERSTAIEDLDTGPDTDLPPALSDGEFDADAFVNRVSDLHQRQIAPESIEKGSNEYKVGNQFRRVLFAHQMPTMSQLAGLKGAMEDPELHFDMSIHFEATDAARTANQAENLYNTLSASIDVESDEGEELKAGDKARRAKRVRQFRDAIEEGDEQPCKMSMYVSARGEEKEAVRSTVEEIRETFRSDADIKLKTLERHQDEAVVAASPIGVDPLRDNNLINNSHYILGSSIGALTASFTRSRKFDPKGHEWGIHSRQGHPIVKDPFQTTRNYNMICVGESGSGKSVNMKRMALTTKAVNPDTMIIMMDPLQGFRGMAEALDAKTITVGGQQTLNPMEIRKPPEEHIQSAAFDEHKDPLSAKIDDVMSFIVNFVASEPGLTLGGESQLLRRLILTAYKQRGITHDVHTHDKESPTLRDVLSLAADARENPREWASEAQEPEVIQKQASDIGNILREFNEDGMYSNLGARSEEGLFGDNDVIYLDLSQEESSMGAGTGVMGQLIFSLAYERCKEYSGPALYIVDEARWMFREAQTLAFLAQRVRHSRHFDTSVRFITQEMGDFFEFDVAEGIVNNSSFKVIHQAPDVENWGQKFDLNERHMEFIKQAATGSEHPYSQALVQFPEDDQWYPLTIELGDRMLAVADFNEQKDDYRSLPGRGNTIEQSPIVRELLARIRAGETNHQDVVDDIFADWEQPLWEILTAEDIQFCLQRINNGEHPRKVVYMQALDRVEWVIEQLGGDQVATEVTRRIQDQVIENFSDSPSEQTAEAPTTAKSGSDD